MPDVRRHTSHPDSRAAVLAFCEAHPVSDHPPDLLLRFLTSLTSGPKGVIRLSSPAGALVASVVDAVQSAADCAVLDLLGATTVDEALLTALLDDAERFVAQGTRAGLEVPITAPWVGHTDLLAARGYAEAFVMFDMLTPPLPPPPAPALPGPQWRWAAPSAESLAAHYRVVCDAMTPVPGSFIGTFDDFCAVTLDRDPPESLLLCGERIAGFCRIHHGDDGLGYIDIIGRAPAFQRHGLGEILLAHAMRRLADGGATHFGLDVSAPNTTALALYQRFGFAITNTMPMYRRMLA